MSEAVLTSNRSGTASRAVVRVPVWIASYGGAVILLGLVHVLLGCSPLVALLAVGSVLISLVPAILYGWRDLPSLLVMLGGVRYVTTAVVWKLMEGSPLDSGLYAPLESFTVVLVGTLATACAAVLAHLLWRRRQVFVERYSAWGYVILAGAGLAFAIAYLVVRASDVNVPGGFAGIFKHGIVLFPLAWMGFNWTRYRRVFTPEFVAGMAVLIIVTLGFNSRQSAGYAAVAIGLFLVGFRVRISPGLAALAAAFVIFFGVVVAPAMSDVRIYKRYLSTSEMVELTIDQIGKRLAGNYVDPTINPDAIYQLHYLKHSNNFTSRLVNVHILDFMVARAESQGPIGTERFYEGLWELLPSIIVRDKSTITHPDYAFWIYGVIPYGVQNFITSTPYGDAYSYGGLSFTFGAVLVAYLLVFLLFRIACPRLEKSILSVFVIAIYAHELTAGYILSVYGVALRTLPVEILVFWLATKVGWPQASNRSSSVSGRA